jgi:hypothetical protein
MSAVPPPTPDTRPTTISTSVGPVTVVTTPTAVELTHGSQTVTIKNPAQAAPLTAESLAQWFNTATEVVASLGKLLRAAAPAVTCTTTITVSGNGNVTVEQTCKPA